MYSKNQVIFVYRSQLDYRFAQIINRSYYLQMGAISMLFSL